ncbi:hypothetical protein PDJAM_G00163120 [Pangasius djambal]|uniref:Uncharacterized protein n=1 Tax=Pangasius djambal TaxID=1691987 RepID=A0ACC5ZL38_9TELE|nr:hypothetical protein [Pangasius djambal]
MEMNDTKPNPVNSAAIARGGGEGHALTCCHAPKERKKEKQKEKRTSGDMRGGQDRETCWMERTLRWRSFQSLIKDGRREQAGARRGFSSRRERGRERRAQGRERRPHCAGRSKPPRQLF